MGAALLDDDEESKGCQSPVREPEGYEWAMCVSTVLQRLRSGRESAGVNVRGDSARCPLERGCL